MKQAAKAVSHHTPRPYSLEPYRALEDKLALLDQAVALMDGNAITAIVKYQQACNSRDASTKVSMLKTCLRIIFASPLALKKNYEGWFGGKKMKAAIGFDKVVEILYKFQAPPDTLIKMKDRAGVEEFARKTQWHPGRLNFHAIVIVHMPIKA
nr:hypothetical protein BaRGS_014178 [Batillaria attramentaria]